jgi:hypothetical protein
MMKNNILYLFLILIGGGIQAQDFVQVSYGTSYSSQAYYRLSDDNTEDVFNELWDIAFTAIGLQDAGIHINEATASMGTELELWVAPTTDFDDDVDVADLVIRLYNDEKSWEYGAFNSLRNETNPFDLGWGAYNPATQSVEGKEVFVIKLRNGKYKKFMISGLNGTVYNLRWADLDGSNEVMRSIDKLDYNSEDLVLLDVQEDKIHSAPAPFDLLFTRYVSPLDDGNGGILNYSVSGVLSGPGIEVAQANGIDPDNVQFSDWKDSLRNEIDIIAYDWKEINLSTFQWDVATDRAYFVKDRSSKIWKVIFVDFEGSSTGNTVFTKELVGDLSPVKDLVGVRSSLLYPNPAESQTSLIVDLDRPIEATLIILDITGREMSRKSVSLNNGLNILDIDVDHLTTGSYTLSLSNQTGTMSTMLVIR